MPFKPGQEIISSWNKGKHLSAEHRAKISLANKGKRTGKTWEEIFGAAQARSMRERAVARRRTPEQGERTSISLKKAYAEGRKAKPNWSGPTHPAWKGGHKDLRLMSPEWKKRRKEVYARDQWLCRRCGKHCGAKEIQCHHVIPYRISQDDSTGNLVTLCLACHCAIERPHDKYRPEMVGAGFAYALGASAGTLIGMLIRL